LELLSFSYKEGVGWEEYQHKRQALLRESVNLVELDMLRRGRRPSMRSKLPAGDCYAFVSRVERYPNCDVYAWPGEQRLPAIPVPLKSPDPDIVIDLAAVFATTYERGRYEPRIANREQRRPQ
jgi:hypothetical protein